MECAELAKDKAYEFVTDRSLPSILGVTSKDDFVVDDMDREFNYSGSDIKTAITAGSSNSKPTTLKSKSKLTRETATAK